MVQTIPGEIAVTHFADRLNNLIRERGTPLCLGLDPRWESLPVALRSKFDDSPDGRAAAYLSFCSRVLDLVGLRVPVVKPQAAFFEACGPAGFAAMRSLIAQAKQMGVITILDGKRNDIASTATAYAESAFDLWGADSLTVNPYLGRDAVEPFVMAARAKSGGVFVLVRTSNPGAGLFQDLRCDGQPLYRHVGDRVAEWTRANLGSQGWGDVGAVVGATYPDELAQLREALPEVIFLVPGFGAQGGTAADVRAAFRSDGLGAVINSSRGILFPFMPNAADWETRIVKATEDTIGVLAFG
ncbi:MAG: orotidine-5'-phosphate decarboxylase [Planctomycetia bacterium]|nr:orotidine-5'-phosphate decarboxylase [Planctomycetia bacterium]